MLLTFIVATENSMSLFLFLRSSGSLPCGESEETGHFHVKTCGGLTD